MSKIILLKSCNIFVEGADGIGKTTLSKKLSTILHIPLLKMVKAKKAFNADTIEDLSYVFNHTLLQLKNASYVIDRGPISSIIYSNVFNRDDDLEYLYSICKKINPVVFYLTSTNYKQMFTQKKNDSIITTQNRVKVFKEYNNFFKCQTIFNVVKINVHDKTRKEVAEVALKYLIQKNYISKNEQSKRH